MIALIVGTQTLKLVTEILFIFGGLCFDDLRPLWRTSLPSDPGFVTACGSVVVVGCRAKSNGYSVEIHSFSAIDGKKYASLTEPWMGDNFRENASCGPRGIPVLLPAGLVCFSRSGKLERIDVSSKRGELSVGWRVDLASDYCVFARDDLDSGTPGISPKLVGQQILTATGNGSTHNMHDRELRIPAPTAPAWVCCDVETGAVLWTNNDPSTRVVHSTNASPVALSEEFLVASGGDGDLYLLQRSSGKTVSYFPMLCSRRIGQATISV